MVIYKLYNIKNNNTYIGQTKNLNYRKSIHKSDLLYNKHHQWNLQTEFNLVVKELKESDSENKFNTYIDYKSYVFDKYYKFEIIKEFNTYILEQVLTIEDQYILEERNIKEGYQQKTNAEIREQYNKFEIAETKRKEEFARVKEIVKNYPKREKLENLILDYNNNKLICNSEALDKSKALTIVAYFYNNNLNLENKEFTITLHQLKDYTYRYRNNVTDVRSALSKLKRYELIDYPCKNSAELSKIKEHDKIKITLSADDIINKFTKFMRENYIKYEIE